MAILNPTQLSVEAQVIVNETVEGANTGVRIGGMAQDIIDSGVFTVKVSLSSAEILALNTTPIIAIVAPGAGKVIRPIAQVYKLNFGTIAYSGNFLTTQINDNIVFSSQTYLASQDAYDFRSASGFGTANELENQPLVLSVSTSNPINGNGTVDIYITYCIISL